MANNLLLSLLDEGIITDAKGNHVDFSNTVVVRVARRWQVGGVPDGWQVLTSNVGADILARLPPGEPSEAARPAMMERIRTTFAPEFLNRLDEVILFNRLTPAAMEPILDMELRSIDAKLEGTYACVALGATH